MVDEKLRLRDIPTELKLSFSQEMYHLTGVVEFVPPPMGRRSSLDDALGHYIPISRRRDHSWIAYDDNKHDAKVIAPGHNAQYQILLYIKQ